MSIKSDAYAILKFVVENQPTSGTRITDYLEISKERMRLALKYAEDKDWIRIGAKTLGGNYVSIEATADGVDESEKLNGKSGAYISESREESEENIHVKLDRIENTVKYLFSRERREITYNASVYPILIASFIAIAFTSIIEFLKRVLPNELQPILTGVFYFLILICIAFATQLWIKMRENLDVADYTALFSIKELDLTLLPDIRDIFESQEHQLVDFETYFEGFLWNKISFWAKSKGESVQRKEQILKEDFEKKVKEIYYEFDYVDKRNSGAFLEVDLEEDKMRLNIDRSVDFGIAKKILNKVLSIDAVEEIERSGWDH